MMDSQSIEDANAVVVIDEDGDTDLECKFADGTKLLRVSSKVLSLASPVMKKLFTSGFREGVDPSPRRCVPLPEDNGEALLLVCSVVHHHAEIESGLLGVDALENVATLVDKYDMSKTLRTWSACWLEGALESVTPGTFDSLLRSAYLLDDSKSFSKVSWKIICNRIGPFISASKSSITSIMPDICGTVEPLRYTV